MRYLLLIYGSEDVPDPTPEEQGAIMAAYNAFGEHVRSKDAFLGGEALEQRSCRQVERGKAHVSKTSPSAE